MIAVTYVDARDFNCDSWLYYCVIYFVFDWYGQFGCEYHSYANLSRCQETYLKWYELFIKIYWINS